MKTKHLSLYISTNRYARYDIEILITSSNLGSGIARAFAVAADNVVKAFVGIFTEPAKAIKRAGSAHSGGEKAKMISLGFLLGVCVCVGG